MDIFDDGVIALDPGGHIVHLNPAAARLLGRSDESMRGRGLQDVIGQPPIADLMRRLRESALLESTTRIEVEIANNGATIPVEVSVTRPTSVEGPEAFIAILRDVSERRRATAARADQARLLELAYDAILIRQLPADTITFWSQGATEMYGWTAEEALGRVSHQLVETRFPIPRTAILQKLRRTRHWEGELRKRRRGGLEAIVESRWALMPSPSRDQVIEIDRDVTRRAAMEIALRETEQHFRNVFDHSPLGICTVRFDGRILTANPALAQMFGVQLEMQRMHHLADLVYPDDMVSVEAILQRLEVGNVKRLAVENRCRRADGSVFWGRLTASVVTDGTGALQYCVAMVEDVDDRRRVDAAMEHVNSRLQSINRAKSALVSGVSHDFRTALTGIEGFSELLRDQDLEAADVKDLAEDINSEARRLARLIDDLLDLDRMESGQIPLRRRPVDVNALLTSLGDRVRRNVSGHNVTLRLADELPEVEADSDRLTQVFANLFSNAVKYSPSGSTIEVTSEPIDGGVRITMRDGGPGIPHDALESVFDQYVRLEREVSAAVSGTGLGLPIVRQIVRMHDGRVWAENAADGGAILTVELPMSAHAEDVNATRIL
jgi:PAS domain S-box-containing protein